MQGEMEEMVTVVLHVACYTGSSQQFSGWMSSSQKHHDHRFCEGINICGRLFDTDVNDWTLHHSSPHEGKTVAQDEKMKLDQYMYFTERGALSKLRLFPNAAL